VILTSLLDRDQRNSKVEENLSHQERIADADHAAADHGSVRTVLVVDDSKMQRKILAAMLKRWGYRVIEAGSGEDALALCTAEMPELILSDWMMPGMSGIEFCEAYRSLAQEAYGYFILLTSRNEKEDIALGLESGADDFLSKPVNAAELRGRITAGERILSMQAALNDRNRQLEDTLTKLQIVYDAIDRDLDEARRLQQSLVPYNHRQFPSGSLSLLLHPSGHIGGDLVGAFRITDHRIGVFAIDVAGHGIASALMTARLAGYLTPSSPEQNIALVEAADGRRSMKAPREVCAILNGLLLEDAEAQHYFTMVLADCDLESGRITLAQAGHPSPMLIRADGSLRFIGDGGMPIGLIDGAEFTDFECHLGIGDRLLIHSDGFTECADDQGRMLGDDGLQAIVTKALSAGETEILETMVSHLSRFAGSDDFSDDVSACLLERTGIRR